MKQKRLILIDAMSVLHRAFHAYPSSLSTPTGEVVNAVYGFASILLSVIEKLEPTHMAVAWDLKGPTFRHEEYDGYKAKREKPDESLINQIERTRGVVEILNIPQFGIQGFEADDVIGTLSKQAAADDQEVIIVTGDRDALQLVKGDRIKVWMPAPPGKYGGNRGSSLFDEEVVKIKYGMVPEQLIDLKALMGDASDNIPGVKGVGQKTATKLIESFKSLDEIYEVIEKDRTKMVEVIGERLTKKLEEEKEMAYLSQKLGRINREVPIELSWDKCRLTDYDRDKAVALFEELAFKSLINKLPKDEWEEGLEEMFSN